MSALDGFDAFLEDYQQALNEFSKGDPEPAKKLTSRSEDVSIANPYGPPVRGREQVTQTMERAAALRRDGMMTFEIVAKYATAELAYVVEIERVRARVGGREDVTPYALRATVIFRPEDGEWKVIHRHADPITTPQSAESVLKK